MEHKLPLNVPKVATQLSVTSRLALKRNGFHETKKPGLFVKPLRCGEAVFVDFRPMDAREAPSFYTTLDFDSKAFNSSDEERDEIAYAYWNLRVTDGIYTASMIGLGFSPGTLQLRNSTEHPEARKNRHRCRACGEVGEDGSQRHAHHLSYEPEVTVPLCDSCHAKVHHSDDSAYASLRPEQDRPKEDPSYTLEECPGYKGKCRGGGQMRVPVDGEKKRCSRCEREKERHERKREKQRKGPSPFTPSKKPHWTPGDPMP